jgi:gluconolactonase
MLVCDVTEGGVLEIDLTNGEARTVVEHRKGIGGIALHARGLIITGRNVCLKEPSGATTVILAPDVERGVQGFNDLVVDARGRIYVGAMCFRVADGYEAARPGLLYRIDVDGSAHVIDDDVLLPNGIAISPEGDRLYHSDSLRHVVWTYPVGPDGELGKRTVFATVPRGMTDGLAIGEDGSVWVAVAQAGLVLGFNRDGSLRHGLCFESPEVTSVCFGQSAGASDLYVTTGPERADPALRGALLRVPLHVGGLRRPRAQVAIPV